MKKIWGLYSLAVVIFLNSDPVYAEDIASKIGFGGNWFFYLSNDAEWEDTDLKNEETTASGNARISYCLPEPTKVFNANLILDWEWISRDITIDEDTDPLSDNFGTLTMMPVMLTFQLRFANLGIVVPYLGVGGGICFNNIAKGEHWEDLEELAEKQAPQKTGKSIDLDVRNSLCFKIPLGMEVFITDYLALNFEAKYFYNKPNVDIDEEDLDDYLDQSTVAFGAGFTFYF
jgi:opacity protein-like surface antigen